jgi:hypothetical protein
MRAQMHGLLPDHSRAALLILDMISDFQIPDGPKVRHAGVAIRHVVRARTIQVALVERTLVEGHVIRSQSTGFSVFHGTAKAPLRWCGWAPNELKTTAKGPPGAQSIAPTTAAREADCA